MPPPLAASVAREVDLPIFDVDLVVVGAGMAGMTVAGLAARSGARVVVLEKAPAIGGSALLSGGWCWAFQSLDTLREEVPLGDPELQRVVVLRYPDAVEWIRSTGAEVQAPTSNVNVPNNVGHLIDIFEYLNRCRSIVQQADGHVMVNVSVERLCADDGRVVGAIVSDTDGSTFVRSPWTVLATGGFQANPLLVERYIGRHATRALLRSNSYSTGDGLQLGLSVGAATVEGMDGFYGHLIAYPLEKEFVPGDFAPLAQSYSAFGLLVDQSGRRFHDESLAYHRNTQATARLPEGRALIVGDKEIHDTYVVRPNVQGMDVVDRHAQAAAVGAHVISVESIAGLCARVESWGYDGAQLRASIDEFNALVLSDPDALDPPRKRHRRAMVAPPFFAIEVQPSITFTHGGLRIDTGAQVLDETGHPIPGLLAVGTDGAGVHNIGYAGGLATSATLAMQAFDTVCSQ